MKNKAAYVKLRLGARVRELRKSQGLTQRFFSLMVGIDRSYLISIEHGRGNVSIGNIVKIAEGLDISLAELFRDM